MTQEDVDAFVADRAPPSLASTQLPALADAPGLRTLTLFSLNDYLGLSTHPEVRRAAADAALQCGNGARRAGQHACEGRRGRRGGRAQGPRCGQATCRRLTALHRLPACSPLIHRAALLGAGGRLHHLARRPGGGTGRAEGHRGLPAVPHRSAPPPPLPLLAPLPLLPSPLAGGQVPAAVGGVPLLAKPRPALRAHHLARLSPAMIAPAGFAANLAVVSSLCADGDVVVLSDELNHASIVDGARLARRGGCRLLVYRHNDLAHLEQLLRSEVPPGAPRAAACRLRAAARRGWTTHRRMVPRAARLRPCAGPQAPSGLALVSLRQAPAPWSLPTRSSPWMETLPTCRGWPRSSAATASCW